MQVKPSFSKEMKLSRMSKAIHILSKLYILPIDVDYKSSKMDFSLFSNRTLTNVIILMMPHLIYYVINLFQTSYVVAALENFYNKYNIIDFTGMMIFPVLLILTPAPNLKFILVFSKLWSSVPEITLNTSLGFPRNARKLLVCMFIQTLSVAVFALGIFLSNKNSLEQFSYLQNFLNLFLAMFVLQLIRILENSTLSLPQPHFSWLEYKIILHPVQYRVRQTR